MHPKVFSDWWVQTWLYRAALVVYSLLQRPQLKVPFESGAASASIVAILALTSALSDACSSVRGGAVAGGARLPVSPGLMLPRWIG